MYHVALSGAMHAFERNRHVAIQSRCFLCDHDLLEVNTSGHRRPEFIALFSVRGSVRTHSSQNIQDFVEEASNWLVLPGFSKEIYRFHAAKDGDNQPCAYCNPENPILFSHPDCWDIVNKYQRDQTRLYRFAIQTQPLVPWRGRQPHSRLWGFYSLANIINTETNTGQLISNISCRLPPELQRKIMLDLQHVPKELPVQPLVSTTRPRRVPCVCMADKLARLAVVELEVIPLLQQLDLTIDPVIHISHPFSGNEKTVSTLYIRTRSIFGRDYITEMGFDPSPRGGDVLLSTDISSHDVKGLRFALGRFGLRAVRVLYADGSQSPWLGDHSGSWFGNEEGYSFDNLCLTADGLRVLSLSLAKSNWQPRRGFRHALADREIEASPGQVFPITNIQTHYYPRLISPYHKRWKMVCHLPLQFGSNYSTGLTMYWTDHRLTGIASYGPTGQLGSIGRRTGEAMHFPLAREEYFTALWIRLGNNFDLIGEAFLLSFTTNMGRTCHFGPHFLQRHEPDRSTFPYEWERLGLFPGPGKITGILVEAQDELAVEGYRNLGIVEERSEFSDDASMISPPTIETLGPPCLDTPDTFPFSLLRLTTGSTWDVTSLMIRRVGRRCLGLRVVHSSGLDDFLGSWDPHDSTSISTLYDSSEGPLTALRFQMVEEERDQKQIVYVSDIVACVGRPDLQSTQETSTLAESQSHQLSNPLQSKNCLQFLCGNREKRLAWWFDDACDELQEYNAQPPAQTIIDKGPAGIMAVVWNPPSQSKGRLWWWQAYQR